MNNDLRRKKSDYLLELALEEQLEYDEDMLKYKAQGEGGELHVFSEEHNKRMQRIFRMAEKVEKKSERRRRFRHMAAGIAVFLCASTIMVTQVEAFRIPFIRFFTETKEKSTLFGVKVEETKEASKNTVEKYVEYVPEYTLEGFEISNVKEGDGNLYIEYVNEQEQQKYEYWFCEKARTMAIDTEDGETEETRIDGNKAYVTQKKGKLRVLMYESENQFYLSGDLSYNEAEKIMESIK